MYDEAVLVVYETAICYTGFRGVDVYKRQPQYRPLNPEWPEVADIVSNYISDVFAKQISAEEAKMCIRDRKSTVLGLELGSTRIKAVF